MSPDPSTDANGLAPQITELGASGRQLLRTAIAETPETLMSLEQLRRGVCRAYVLGPVETPLASAIQPQEFPGDVSLYGQGAGSIWTLLRQLEGWEAADVAPDVARDVAAWAGWATRRPVVFSRELFFTLEAPVPRLVQPAVRMLEQGDLPVMEAATEPLHMGSWRFGSAAALLAEGQVAGAIVGAELVAVAFTAAQGERYVDVGIVTREDARGQGLATAAASLLCAAVQAGGRTPVWGTSEENLASRRVAAKLGFREVGQRVYLNLA
ncbi:MAG: GNAT family N-acetyltransferase [Thermomicrobiales bacterium]